MVATNGFTKCASIIVPKICKINGFVLTVNNCPKDMHDKWFCIYCPKLIFCTKKFVAALVIKNIQEICLST
jgi:hypothetical protein